VCFLYFGAKKENGEERREKKEEGRRNEEEGRRKEEEGRSTAHEMHLGVWGWLGRRSIAII
jgi:hypothetical protein